jgi:formate hydrogenlyase subunit 3/multisubunit Na+/H+ antiporter MnhD subunit
MMGYGVMVEIGLSLLALGASNGAGDEINLLPVFFILFLPRGLALGVWALALVVIQTRTQDLRFRSVQGLARSLPIACMACVVAHFSLAGFPLLAGFPAHLALWENLAASFPYAALVALLGNAGLLVGGLRTLAVLVMGTGDEENRIIENGPQKLLLGLGTAALVVVGLLPQWFLPIMTRLATVFVQEGP